MFSEEVEIIVVNEEDVDKDGDSPGNGGDREEVDDDLGNKVVFLVFSTIFPYPLQLVSPLGTIAQSQKLMIRLVDNF